MLLLSDEQPAPMSASSVSEYELPNNQEKQLVHAASFEKDIEEDVEDDVEDDVTPDDDEQQSACDRSDSIRSKNGLKDCLKETFKNVTGKTGSKVIVCFT